MQGNLNEIDIRSILQLIEWGQRTGQLLVEAHSFGNSAKFGREVNRHYHSFSGKQQSWLLFFLNGQIIYCQQGDSNLSRIDDYLRHYQGEMQLDHIQRTSLESAYNAEYSYLWALLEHNIINPKVARNIMHAIVHETLFDLLSLYEGSFIFHQNLALTPQLSALEIAPSVTKIAKQLQEWKQLYPHIQSPEQLPILADVVQLHSSLPAETVNKLKHWADGKTSLRQLARYLNRDILTVAKAMYPYVQQGWLKLVYSITNNYDTPTQECEGESRDKARIVCIDDAMSIGETIESILQPRGYEVLTLTNPLEALSFIFQFKPDMILCDITMPELDGYEICSMLRHSRAFRLIPIIMLSDQDQFIDRVKARMAGTTDYLTKPFADAELITLVEKYINIEPFMCTQKRYKTC
ncbi:MAG: response regulator [Mojavia pulchra JT2-VF2]|jgi:twitching motility two-component system response regulator PilG|uniref:Protein PatA n=1 Tax=Mojavia pulchra JT2-VF2 TaxID=287848 RepID=A0A951UI77_9NOST|nr:response regulator [Mojavia pulchra JT2-VF2]